MRAASLATRTILGLLTPLLLAGGAQAVPLAGSFKIEIFQGDGGGTIGSPGVQANLGNPLLATGAVATITYTGSLNFNSSLAPDGLPQNSLAGFIGSGGGSYTGTLLPTANGTLSGANFGFTSVFRITATIPSPISGTVTHDDGVSIYSNGATVLAPGPVSETVTQFAGVSGNVTIIYVEANSVPAVLRFDLAPVPEPASVALLGAGLAGLGLVGRRRKAA